MPFWNRSGSRSGSNKPEGQRAAEGMPAPAPTKPPEPEPEAWGWLKPTSAGLPYVFLVGDQVVACGRSPEWAVLGEEGAATPQVPAFLQPQGVADVYGAPAAAGGRSASPGRRPGRDAAGKR